MQTERHETKTSPNLSSNSMLTYQLSQKLELLGEGPNNLYQSIQHLLMEQTWL